jgi:hypothetical protein
MNGNSKWLSLSLYYYYFSPACEINVSQFVFLLIGSGRTSRSNWTLKYQVLHWSHPLLLWTSKDNSAGSAQCTDHNMNKIMIIMTRMMRLMRHSVGISTCHCHCLIRLDDVIKMVCVSTSVTSSSLTFTSILHYLPGIFTSIKFQQLHN